MCLKLFTACAVGLLCLWTLADPPLLPELPPRKLILSWESESPDEELTDNTILIYKALKLVSQEDLRRWQATNTIFSGQMLLNGSFEETNSGWVITGNARISGYRVLSGTNAVNFNSGQTEPNGVVSQIIPTVPGHHYQLTYAQGVLGWNRDEQTMRVEAIGDTNHVEQIVKIASLVDGEYRFVESHKMEFVADSPNTRIEFTDISATTINVDMFLDAVDVRDLDAPRPPATQWQFITAVPATNHSVTLTVTPQIQYFAARESNMWGMGPMFSTPARTPNLPRTEINLNLQKEP